MIDDGYIIYILIYHTIIPMASRIRLRYYRFAYEILVFQNKFELTCCHTETHTHTERERERERERTPKQKHIFENHEQIRQQTQYCNYSLLEIGYTRIII
jgi:hypothetical protein